MSNLNKHIIKELKDTILKSRYRAAKSVNKALVDLYFNIGNKISTNTKAMAWGSKVLEQIATELQNELPGLKGFSATNLKRMEAFYDFWSHDPSINQISPTVSDEIQITDNQVNTIRPTMSDEFKKHFYSVSFSHHYLIASKSKSIEEARFYIKKISIYFWSYRNLQNHFKNRLFEKEGTLFNNFDTALDTEISNKAIQSFKDEYLLDFINIEDPDEENERLIESEIVRNLKKFMLNLGNDFAFIGNQHRVIVAEKEYFIDLLFYNRKLQALVAFELKKGEFKPEYLGKMNFYLSALDDLVKQAHEKPSIGIILCKEKNNKIVEYSFRSFNKAMGVATYKTSIDLPEHLKNDLPDVETLKKLMG